jgi:hypothetical protein
VRKKTDIKVPEYPESILPKIVTEEAIQKFQSRQKLDQGNEDFKEGSQAASSKM